MQCDTSPVASDTTRRETKLPPWYAKLLESSQTCGPRRGCITIQCAKLRVTVTLLGYLLEKFLRDPRQEGRDLCAMANLGSSAVQRKQENIEDICGPHIARDPDVKRPFGSLQVSEHNHDNHLFHI